MQSKTISNKKIFSLDNEYIDVESNKKKIKKKLQTLVFSATLTFTHSVSYRADGTQIPGQTTVFKVTIKLYLR